ncbi:MAG: hypothetical protein A2148_03350 [Chloroflexi bacterium RBG_16_68_14]|nr:MAG: hypothetical protein A2148_03350 [Chloroflexi bacterium RBG_16_68_14]
MEIQGKVALVTGAGSGIGRATALRLAREGASVVVADIDEAGGRETMREIEKAGGRAAFVRADVTEEKDVQAMIAFAQETFGGLDILHNNAGILTDQPRFPDAEPERWSRVLEINLRGVILGTQYGIQSMRQHGGGVIVQTASLAGIIGFATDPVYAATKGGVVLFTASLAPLKDAANIRVNCVCPGIVDTPMLHRGQEAGLEEEPRLAAMLRDLPLIPPEEVADAVVELIRDDSLAGRAMLIPNGLPRSLAPQPPVPLPGR